MLLMPSPQEFPAVAGAIKGGVAGEAGLLPEQAATIRAVTRALGGGNVDIDAVPPMEPERAANVLTSSGLRRQVIQAMVVLSFMEHPPSEDRLHSIQSYATAFDVDEKAVQVYKDYALDHRKRMMLDTFRYMPIAEWERHYAKQEGIGTVARSFLALLGKGESPELTAKFTRLERCPDGSLGRRFWEMYQQQGWPFPGQHGGVPEATTVHDWVHVLSGYAPTPIGEIQVTAFITALSPDPAMFGALLLSLGLYEAGAFALPQFPQAPHGGAMEQPHAPEALADALRRGRLVNTDIMEGVDHWALADEPVADLRERFNIVPKHEPAPTPDPGA
jgi:hypothetical protein